MASLLATNDEIEFPELGTLRVGTLFMRIEQGEPITDAVYMKLKSNKSSKVKPVVRLIEIEPDTFANGMHDRQFVDLPRDEKVFVVEFNDLPKFQRIILT